MATSSGYFIDGLDLQTASSIYTDSTRVTVAPDGFYSDSEFSREMRAGVLLPPVRCTECTPLVEYNMTYSIENNVTVAKEANIVSLELSVESPGISRFAQISDTVPSLTLIPEGTAIVALEVQYDEIVTPNKTLDLIIQSPSGTVLKQVNLANPNPGTYTVSETINVTAAFEIVAIIEGT